MSPVIRLSDSNRRLVAHGEAARLHDNTAILRLRPYTEATDAADAKHKIDTALRFTKLSPDQVDLIIDLGQIDAATLTSVATRAAALVTWSRAYPWRCITVATGAMPATLSGLPAPGCVAIQRSDWLLWRQLRHLNVTFGDYGVRSPTTATTGGPRGPMPNLRYTTDTCWWVHRWPHSDGSNRHGIYPLCRMLVTSDHWTPDGPGYSWGDHQILERAGHLEGPGTATDWIAWATSRHLTHAITQLDDAMTPPLPGAGTARDPRHVHDHLEIHEQPPHSRRSDRNP